MLKKQEDYKVDLREKMRDGNGKVRIDNFVSCSELNDKGRLFGKITLEPGCSIGYHVHEHDAEIFYILKGIAEYNDSGTIITVRAGDTTICPTGTGHSIANGGSETLELIALIVYE